MTIFANRSALVTSFLLEQYGTKYEFQREITIQKNPSDYCVFGYNIGYTYHKYDIVGTTACNNACSQVECILNIDENENHIVTIRRP